MSATTRLLTWFGRLSNTAHPYIKSISIIKIYYTNNMTPEGGLFRYHVKIIRFTMQGFGFLSAIWDEAKLKASYYYGWGSAAII